MHSKIIIKKEQQQQQKQTKKQNKNKNKKYQKTNNTKKEKKKERLKIDAIKILLELKNYIPTDSNTKEFLITCIKIFMQIRIS